MKLAVAALALSLAACSSHAGSSPERASEKTSAGDATASTTKPVVIASSDQAEGSAGISAAGKAEEGDTPAPSAEALAALPPDWLAGKPADRNPDAPMIVNCTMERGKVCRIRVQGFYRLSTAEAGHITAAVYEDGAAQPAQTAGQGLAVPKGSSRWYLYVPYRVSDTATTITVEASLTGPTGAVLYRGERHTYRIP